MTLQQLKEQEIVEVTKQIIESEPVERLLGIESTAIVTGRASQYHGKILPEVIKEALSSHDLRLEQAIREETSRKIDEYFKGLIVIPDPQVTKESIKEYLLTLK